ncbi:MAG: hypothetical protein AAB432_02795 [Patescibacteria group bacterium]
MVSEDLIKKIITAGVQAPSGGNSQPWRFEVRGETVSFFMIPERDHSVLNFHRRGTLLASGALLENISVAARHYGFEPIIDFFPNKNIENLVAHISFKKTVKHENKLFEAIWKRATNRKQYKLEKVSEEIKKELMEIPKEVSAAGISVKFTDEKEKIEKLATASSANEIVMFENKILHKLFFNEIVWTEEEERQKKSGLYLKTMELKPPEAAALRLFKHWPLMKFFGFLGAARGIAKSNARNYASCGLYGGVLCDNSDISFVAAGKAIELIWLKATALGLSFHLQSGVNFLWQRLNSDNTNIFSKKHADLINNQYKIMAEIFNSQNKILTAVFRLGYGGEPSGRSSRKTPNINFS